MTEQHYRMTLADAVAMYQSGDITAKGALKLWARIRLKEEWTCTIDPQEMRSLLSGS